MKKFKDYFECVPTLETERFLLVPFAREDMDEYFDILRDERVQRYLGGGVPLFDKEPNITNWLHNINDRLLKRKLVFTWCVKEKLTGRVLGRIDLGGFVKQTMAEIAYHYAYDYWGKGVASEVVARVTAFGINELRLQRIQGIVHIENEASMRVLEKNGYQREGTLHYYPFGREFHDVVMFAIVKRLDMNLKLVKASAEYRNQISDMMEEWNNYNEKIVPYAIRRSDYRDFKNYCNSLEIRDDGSSLVPDSTFFCLDTERNIMVGAVNIRHYLNESLLLNGGHIGDGVRPSERRKGIATKMIALALEECRKLGIKKVLMVCDKNNIGSAKSIINNGGILENEIEVDGVTEQRYWIDMAK